MTFQTGEGLGTGVPASALFSLAELVGLRDAAAALEAAKRGLDLQPESPRGNYFAGLFALRAGDRGFADERLAALQQLAAAASGPAGPIYRDVLAAEIAIVDGDVAEARRTLEQVVGEPLWFDWMATWANSGPMFHDALARACLATGDVAPAIETLEALVESGWMRLDYPVTYVRSLHKLGVLELGEGNESEGQAYLRRVLEHWDAAEWAIDEVIDARARIR